MGKSRRRHFNTVIRAKLALHHCNRFRRDWYQEIACSQGNNKFCEFVAIGITFADLRPNRRSWKQFLNLISQFSTRLREPILIKMTSNCFFFAPLSNDVTLDLLRCTVSRISKMVHNSALKIAIEKKICVWSALHDKPPLQISANSTQPVLRKPPDRHRDTNARTECQPQ